MKASIQLGAVVPGRTGFVPGGKKPIEALAAFLVAASTSEWIFCTSRRYRLAGARSYQRPCFLAVAALLGAWACDGVAAAATVEGRVELPKSRATPVVNQRYAIVAQAGVLSTNPPIAVVYLEGDFPKPEKQPVTEITQKNLTFLPSLLPVQIGTKVEFPNFDDTYHNIFSFSPTKRFDLGRYRSDEKPVPSVVFDVAGLVTLRCDIHDHMRALILVLETPHFVITNADGNFRLTGLPEGRYKLKAWIDSKTTREHVVDLKDDATLRVDFVP